MIIVSEESSTLFVPLRSNANTLLTGAPIAAMRRRLKFASLFYDQLFIESGVLRLQAGSGGMFSTVEYPPTPERWQTPVSRNRAERTPLHLAVGREPSPGVAPAEMKTALYSDTTHCWIATLQPFAQELPSDADWVEFVRSIDPVGDVDRLARRWRWADDENPALERAIPGRFMRGAVIANANRDLAIAAASGFAIACDPLHQQVVTQRFNDDEGWQLRGYSIPILFPQVGELSWEAIANLRGDPNITRFRAVLREVEYEATTEASTGDVEAAAHHAYEKHLADASGRLENITAVARRTTTGIVIGGAIGAATSPIAGPLGIVISTAAGGVVSTIQDIRSTIRQRRSRGWVAVHHRITEASS